MAGNQANGRPAAEVLLASGMIADEELRELVDSVLGGGVRLKDGGRRLCTGVKSVDDALDGGIVSGRVVGVWGELGGGANELCRAAVVNCLLEYPDCTVAVIDTTGNFDVLGLYALILGKLKKDVQVLGLLCSSTDSDNAASAEDVAAKILDHVNIMRVFDFVGVREAINEIRDGLEGKKPAISNEHDMETFARDDDLQPPEHDNEIPPHPPPGRTVVADSEDEDEDADEDEMLFDIPEPTTDPPSPEQDLQPAIPEPHSRPSPVATPHPPSHTKLILIDNLAHVLTPLLKKDLVQGTALAAPFLHSLNSLTRTQHLYTLVSNPATYPRPVSPARYNAQAEGRPAQLKKQAAPLPPSVFASNSLVPSLPGVMMKFVDVGLLVSKLPRRKMDARVFYRELGNAGQTSGAVKKLRGVEMVNVVEVLSDRWEGRVGAWGSFTTHEDILKDL